MRQKKPDRCQLQGTPYEIRRWQGSSPEVRQSQSMLREGVLRLLSWSSRRLDVPIAHGVDADG